MRTNNIYKNVIIIGPDYKNHRGGIGALIATHSKYYNPFKFISTFKPFSSNIIKGLFYFKQFILIIVKLISDRNINIVHIHGSQDGSFFRKYFIFIVAKYIFRKKIVYHCHASHFDVFYEDSNNFFKKVIRGFIENVDIVISLSDSWTKFFGEKFKCKKLKKLYNCIEPVTWGDNISVLNKNININLLFLGRIGERKGVFELLEVLSGWKNVGNISLSIGGDGEIDRLKTIIHNNGLSQVVDYLGWVDGSVKDKLLRGGGIFVLPSYHEGLPISILEAMNYGLPIISTKVGGIPEAVQDGVNGILIEPGDKEGLKKALLYFNENPSEIERMGRESKRLIQKFYPESVFLQLEEIYKELLNNEN